MSTTDESPNGHQRHAYDLVITGGHVIDPAMGRSEVLDLAIIDGRIARVERGIAPEAGRRHVDASGQIVTPGLIDLHTHVYWGATYWGIEADPVAARSGVTTWLDVGSAGGYSFPGFREYIVKPAKTRIYALLNLSSIGLIAPTWELSNPDYWDVGLAAEVVERNRDVILGIKIRIDSRTTRGVGIEPMKHARELADRVGLPLMTHIGSAPPSIEELMPYLRPGDILTHCFTWQDMGIFQEDGHIRPGIRELQQQGLILDVGHGTGSFGYDVAEKMMADGILPDVISTDIHQLAVQGPAFDMPTTLSKFLNLGMSLEDVIARATINPAKAVNLHHLDHLGSLEPGSPADISLFRIEEGDFTFYDVRMAERRGARMLVSTATFVDGHELPRTAEREVHFWAELPDAQKPILHAAGPGAAVPGAEAVVGGELLEDLHEQQEGQ
ncbi:MAG TPA: amidohydrolase/deacetylase family metallohydrolase [Thermomicrobiales bacterium]|nr:amidohydrolase/deacetylase family metallohydrolase [Thermomicrobiales bacterium]